MSRLEAALAFTLTWEGGYVNDPADPGGATNHGVTQAVYDAYRAAQKKPKQAVRLIADAEVREIYATRYWALCRCGALPAPVDAVVFDTAVNCGVERACRWLQHAVGVAEDGDVGAKTLAAVASHPPAELARAVIGLRVAYYQRRVDKAPTQRRFLNGWLNRAHALQEVVDGRD